MNQDNNSGSSTMNDDNGANANNSSSNDGLNNELSSMNIDSSNSSSIDNKSSKKDTCLCCLQEVEGCSRCSKCRTALYCNRVCQEKHWPVHKNVCQDSNDENSDDKLNMKAMNHFKQGNN